MLGKLAKSMKDGALGIALKAYVNDRLGDYGDVLECSVDTSKGRISARVLLKGETEWTTWGEGQSFNVPGNSSFEISVAEGDAYHYVCHFG